MTNTTSSNKKDLAKISGRKDWKLWTDKLRAYLIRSELEFVMDQPFPNFQIMVPSDVPGLGERLESPIELLTRQRGWLEGNKRLWGALIEAVEGDAASVVQGARKQDGLHAYQLLKNRYESTSASSGLMVFFSLLMFTMTEPLEKHVQQFKDKILELAPHKGWALNPMQTCSIFLRSLGPKFRTWVQKTMTDADRNPAILYDPIRIYEQTIEWERTSMFASGEANNSGKALWTDSSQQSDTNITKDRADKKRPVCRHWRKGNCTWGKRCKFRHPDETESNLSSEDGDSSSSEEEQEERESRKRKHDNDDTETLKKKLKQQQEANQVAHKAFQAMVKQCINKKGLDPSYFGIHLDIESDDEE